MKSKLRALVTRQSVVAGLVAALFAFVAGGYKASPYNNFVLLAQAFLAGHVWINWPGPYIDALEWNGLHYIIEAPVPAILLMPFVAIFGGATSQSLLGVALAGIAIGALWNTLERMQVCFQSRLWLALFAFAGTDLWWCASLGDVWFVAHLGAVAATLLALRELAGAKRPWLVALWGCLAVGCRFSLLMALPVYAMMLLIPLPLGTLALAGGTHSTWLQRARISRTLLPFAGVLLVALYEWVQYNIARWSQPFDIGYTAWYHLDQMGSPTGSPFALHYFPYEFLAFFWAFPNWLGQFPWFDAPITGICLPLTSPALILAVFARGERRIIALLWLATLLVAGPSFVYYADGFAQFGMRHALDFEPFLFILMGLALRRGIAWWGRLLIVFSSLVGTWGVWYWHAIMGR